MGVLDPLFYLARRVQDQLLESGHAHRRRDQNGGLGLFRR